MEIHRLGRVECSAAMVVVYGKVLSDLSYISVHSSSNGCDVEVGSGGGVECRLTCSWMGSPPLPLIEPTSAPQLCMLCVLCVVVGAGRGVRYDKFSFALEMLKDTSVKSIFGESPLMPIGNPTTVLGRV